MKGIAPSALIALPVLGQIHPSRLIVRDGTLMWKHALTTSGVIHVPSCAAIESHIVKTAQRLEELSRWLMDLGDVDDGFVLKPIQWYDPSDPELRMGISVYLTHASLSVEEVFDIFKEHILPHETLELRDNYLFFRRC